MRSLKTFVKQNSLQQILQKESFMKLDYYIKHNVPKSEILLDAKKNKEEIKLDFYFWSSFNEDIFHLRSGQDIMNVIKMVNYSLFNQKSPRLQSHLETLILEAIDDLIIILLENLYFHYGLHKETVL